MPSTRNRRLLLIAAAAAVVSAFWAMAQESGGPGGPPRGQRPTHPLEVALDANGDGIIDASEIANATAALKKLDTNHDGKLTGDEYRPQHPPGPPPTK